MLGKRVKLIGDCLPEMQNELNSLNLDTAGDSYYISITTQLSRVCSALIYGSTPGD